MSIILFLDTETTSRLDFKAPLTAKHQPRLVQLATLLCTDAGDFIESTDQIVYPDGFEIPDEASAIHGITTGIARADGRSIAIVLAALAELMRKADLAVAFNWDFDSKIIEGEYLRRGMSHELARPHACAMLRAKDHCQIPGRYGDFKWPKLSEAYEHFFNEQFDGQHRADGDCAAIARVWFEMIRREKTNDLRLSRTNDGPMHSESRE